MNVNIYSEKFTSQIKEEIEELIKVGCEKLDPKVFIENCSLKTRAKRFFYYIVLSTIANFSTGFIFQEDKNKENKFYNLLRIIGATVFFILGIIGMIIPIIPGIPLLFLSFVLVYKQIISNNEKETL